MTNFTGNIDYNYTTDITNYGSLDLGPWDTTMATSNTYTINPSSTTAGSIFVSTGTYGTPTWTTGASPVQMNQSGKIQLTGEGADVEINGLSLKKVLEGIEDRLGMLRPAADLEKDWDELRRLGNEYRQLEREIREKMAVWDTLKKQDL
jgi:hypothetical protein